MYWYTPKKYHPIHWISLCSISSLYNHIIRTCHACVIYLHCIQSIVSIRSTRFIPLKSSLFHSSYDSRLLSCCCWCCLKETIHQTIDEMRTMESRHHDDRDHHDSCGSQLSAIKVGGFHLPENLLISIKKNLGARMQLQVITAKESKRIRLAHDKLQLIQEPRVNEKKVSILWSQNLPSDDTTQNGVARRRVHWLPVNCDQISPRFVRFSACCWTSI